jgi:predicted AlkP superfamily phosphohydrolase/phosphomutase
MAERRLLVIGFDAMDVELVRRWAAAGYLPTFRRLLESAAWSDYIDPPEHMSGTIWTSINTGVGPPRHDFQFFIRFSGGSYRVRPARAEDIKANPFWKWFAESGRRIVLADIPYTVSKPEYGGKQFWGWGPHDVPWKRSSEPRGLISSLSAQFGVHPVPFCQVYSTETDSILRLRAGLLTGIQRRTEILKSLIVGRDWDFFYGVYGEPHCAGHLMWHLEDESHPRHNPEQLATVGHALREIYAAMDQGLAELLACAGTDTTCVVFFSHGMGPNYHGEHLFSDFVARFNYRWEGKGPDVARRDDGRGWFDSVWQGSVRRLPARWRDAVRRQLPTSLRAWITVKRVQNPKLWSRAPAFSIPLMDVFSVLRVNLVGREPRGRIRPGEEYRRYLDAFTEEISQLTNVESGEPAVERIYRADHHADPLTIGSEPDLIVWWRKEHPIRAIRSRTLGTISGEGAEIRTGEHVMRGMLLLSHPQAKPGRHTIPGMNVLDIAATLCDLAGIQPGITLDGTSRRRDLLAE